MDLSIVVPAYNEQENIHLVYEAIIKAITPLKKQWELIMVDDGSKDGSIKEMQAITEKDPEHVSVIILRRNFGQTAAIAAGIDHSCGDTIVLCDADMQNDPIDIPVLMERIVAFQGIHLP